MFHGRNTHSLEAKYNPIIFHRWLFSLFWKKNFPIVESPCICDIFNFLFIKVNNSFLKKIILSIEPKYSHKHRLKVSFTHHLSGKQHQLCQCFQIWRLFSWDTHDPWIFSFRHILEEEMSLKFMRKWTIS